ncbi:hypothetical protein PGTUg99_013401 [Puccinia graminis f. sp. tritici]|uniref:Uncharacterized protein n=1 Tax=Puccinia graminis f. sp. tritici TaxID=56615 RepID=A0A5B0R4T6_PUCGR|nr:hypothetical protein PGTUg99_013401 [Puccinia graminis f. sp. tritici]
MTSATLIVVPDEASHILIPPVILIFFSHLLPHLPHHHPINYPRPNSYHNYRPEVIGNPTLPLINDQPLPSSSSPTTVSYPPPQNLPATRKTTPNPATL